MSPRFCTVLAPDSSCAGNKELYCKGYERYVHVCILARERAERLGLNSTDSQHGYYGSCALCGSLVVSTLHRAVDTLYRALEIPC